MLTFREIAEKIYRMKPAYPVRKKKFEHTHGDGLRETVYEHIYDSSVIDLRKQIMNDPFSMHEKLELVKALSVKLR